MRQLTLAETPNLTYDIIQIGGGGNGSYFFRNLMQMVAGFKETNPNTKFNITIADGDKVEPKNLKNQLFTSDDLKELKTFALIDRYANHYDVDVKEYPKYLTSLEQLNELLSYPVTETTHIPIILGMVDNNRTRQLLHEYFYHEDTNNLIWIDLGIEDTEVVSSPNDDDIKRMMATGFSGQCVIGLKWRGQEILPPVTMVYDNIMQAEDNFPGLSCGDVLPSNPQRMITNQTAAHVASIVLNTLFFTKSIMVSEINFNAQLGHIKPNYITKEQLSLFESIN